MRFYRISNSIIDLKMVCSAHVERSDKNDERKPNTWRILIVLKDDTRNLLCIWFKRKCDAELDFELLWRTFEDMNK